MKTERFEMRLDAQTLTDVDAWRGLQADVPSRAEAIRRLIATGLARTDSSHVHLDDGAKLVATMLRDLYRHLGVNGEIDPDLVTGAIDGGHHWALGWEYPGVFGSEPVDPKLVSEVSAILNMWRSIERAYDSLSDEDKAQVADNSTFHADESLFPGFDANEETKHYSVAAFLVRRLRRFAEFEGRDLNSHWPYLENYRRMLRRSDGMRTDALRGRDLSRDQLTTLLS